MIVNHQHKFVFVQVPKTASTSMKHRLQEYQDYPRIARHATLGQILTKYPGLQHYFKFGVTREKDTWLDSCYRWAKRKQDHQSARRDMSYDEWRESNYSPNWYHRDGVGEFLPPWRDCRPEHWLDGCDFILNFETLDRDWTWACELIGIPHEPLLHLNKDKHK